MIEYLLQIQPPASNAAKNPQWYEIIGGVLAIPAVLIGMAYSYILIKKTRVEAKKFELEAKKFEIEAKKIELEIKGKETNTQQTQEPSVIKELVYPLSEATQIQYLILRFILLYLVLRVWVLLMVMFETIGDGITSIATGISSETIGFILAGIGTLIAQLPTLGYIITAIFLGFPLFREVNKIVGIKSLEDWFQATLTPKPRNVGVNSQETDSTS